MGLQLFDLAANLMKKKSPECKPHQRTTLSFTISFKFLNKNNFMLEDARYKGQLLTENAFKQNIS